jgi:hypothetical protein
MTKWQQQLPTNAMLDTALNQGAFIDALHRNFLMFKETARL